MPQQEFRSTDDGAPIMKGTAGAVTDLLDMLLVNGLPTASVTSISAAGAVVLAVANATLRVLDYITFSGATGGDAAIYNTACRITAITDSTHVTVALPSTPSGAATGTLLYRKSPLGYNIAYTATNKRVYQSANGGSNQRFLRVDDNTLVNVREAYVRGYETMSDIDTGTNPCPTVATVANGYSWNKSSTADATARAWTLIGDDKFFILWITPIASSTITILNGFGEIDAYKPGDAFATIIFGTQLTNYTIQAGGGFSGLQYGVANGATACHANMSIFRKYDQTGTAVTCGAYDSGRQMLGSANQPMGGALVGMPYPNGPDGGLHVAPVEITDHTGTAFHKRGRVPGLYAHMHNSLPQTQYDEATGLINLPGIKLRAVNNITNYVSGAPQTGLLHVDVTGPWT